MPQGRLVLYVGTMFGGKSHALLFHAGIHGYGKLVKAFVPKADTRSEAGAITTHSGVTFPAVEVETSHDIYEFLRYLPEIDGRKVDIVLIDEAHMFDGDLINVVLHLLERGIDVVCGGLTIDFEGNPFEVVTHLMAFADQIEVYRATCKRCGGARAKYHKRLIEDDRRIVPGGEGVYEPQCYQCFHEIGDGETR